MATSRSFTLKERLLIFLIKTIGVPVGRFLCWSYRIEVKGRELTAQMESDGKPYICAFWHQRIFPVMAYYRGSGSRPLVSMSKDGEYIAVLLKGLGYNPVRGSTSRRSYGAFKELLGSLNEGDKIGITPDGPRGPAREVKYGVVYLSKYTDQPVIPVAGGAQRYWIFNSWDRFMLPMPFSRIFIKFGEPLSIGKDADESEADMMRKKIKKSLDTLCDEVDKSMGHNPLPQSRNLR